MSPRLYVPSSDVAYRAVVIDKQDDCASPFNPGGVRNESQAFQNRLLGGPWQIDFDRCSFATAGFNPYAATGLLCEAKNLAQSQPRPLANLFCCEKRLESLCEDFLGHARTSVTNSNHDVVPRGWFF